MQTYEEQVTWATFRTRFLEKYFPNSAKHEREAEFLTLQQGTMTMQAYTDRFEYLARFYSPLSPKSGDAGSSRVDLIMGYVGFWCLLGSGNSQIWLSRSKHLSNWRWGPTEWLDSRRPLQTPYYKRSHTVDHRLRLGNCSVLTLVGSIGLEHKLGNYSVAPFVPNFISQYVSLWNSLNDFYENPLNKYKAMFIHE